MAKPNYSFEKRQRERLKKQKKEEKLAQRRAGGSTPGEVTIDEFGNVVVAPAPAEAQPEGEAPAP